MKKFTSLTFLAVALLFLIAISSVSAEEIIEKRNNVCSEYHYKRNILGKRNNVKKCPCAIARAEFDDDKVKGLVVLSQDECGSTTFTGFFFKGLDDPQKNNYTFAIADDCGNITHDLGTLGATFSNGGTKPFSTKIPNINLNCDKDGLLNQKSAKYSKRTYDTCKKSYYTKRQADDGGSFFNIYDNGDQYSSASIF